MIFERSDKEIALSAAATGNVWIHLCYGN